MGKIIQLDRHVADLIAAGEVVERPASAVKELMENSIDAGAENVTVEIRSGGMAYMRITDDGSGIDPDDVETAFLRHATSKLRDARGLEAIATLGFRGEALAAISAVSRIELITCLQGCAMGRRVICQGGEIVSNDEYGCPDGTTIIVRDLFYNTPARLKFIKTDRAEGSAVSTAVMRAALSHPEVSVKYIKEGKTEFHTPGDGKIMSCMYSIFGREFAGDMLPAESDDEAVSVRGYVSSPRNVKGNRSSQYFFVNGRYIKSKTLQAALEQGYKNSLFTGRYPSCALYITISPGKVDVNVHPTKTEVKFSNEKTVFDAVYYSVLSALEKERAPVKPVSEVSEAVSPADAPPPPVKAAPPVFTGLTGGRTAEPPVFEKRSGSAYKSPAGFKSSVSPAPFERRQTAAARDFAAVSPSPYTSNPPAFSSPASAVKQEVLPVTDNQALPADNRVIDSMPPENSFRIIGEGLKTYIIVESGDSVWFIDKHAAHERMHFDRLKAQSREIMVQPLLLPVICRLSPVDVQLLMDNTEILERFGFSAEPFGQDSIAVRQIPSHIDEKDVESVISDMCAALHGGGESGISSGIDEILHTIACKAAIKAGKASSPEELGDLVAAVMSGRVRYCPHGRPVAVEFTRAALDKSFKRT